MEGTFVVDLFWCLYSVVCGSPFFKGIWIVIKYDKKKKTSKLDIYLIFIHPLKVQGKLKGTFVPACQLLCLL